MIDRCPHKPYRSAHGIPDAPADNMVQQIVRLEGAALQRNHCDPARCWLVVERTSIGPPRMYRLLRIESRDHMQGHPVYGTASLWEMGLA